MEKNFRFRDFWFKIRFETFWIDSDQKNFRPKFFDLVIFSLFWSFWPKKTKSDEKNFTREKNFRFWDFCFKIRFKAFWIDSDQKNFFDQNFLTSSFFHYFWSFCPKKQSPTKKILHGKNFRFRDFRFKIRFKPF